MDDGSRLPLEEGHVKKKSGIFDKLTHIFHGKQQDAVTEKEIMSTLTAACRLAASPTRRSPFLVNATTDGVVREPSAFVITTG